MVVQTNGGVPERKADDLLAAAVESTPNLAWEFLGESLLLSGKFRAVEIFVLDLSIGLYVSRFTSGSNKKIDFSESELDAAVELLEEINGKMIAHEVTIGANKVAFIVVTPEQNTIDSKFKYIAADLYMRERNFALYSNLNRPVRFDVSYESFISDLTSVARDSARMEFGVYRVLRGDSLQAIFSWGFSEDAIGENNDKLTLRIGENEKIDRAAVSGEIQFCYDLPEEFPSFVASYPFQKVVRSFLAIPVKVGSGIEGVISVATSKNYRFSEIEKSAFLCIANGLGVALSNFQLYRDGRTKGVEFEKMSSSIIGVEVAQSIRHDILLNAGNINNAISQIESLIKKDERINSTAKESYSLLIGIVKKESDKINMSVSKLKNVMKVDRVVRIADVSDLWRDAVSHVSYRLKELGVSVTQPGRKPAVPLLTDLIKHIFHNLLLNSIDAFATTSKSSRIIDLRVEKFDNKMRTIHLIYSDTGPGIDKHYIESKRSAEDRDADINSWLQMPGKPLDSSEIIFEKGFTTRKNGSGYGLFLARRMAKYHGGSIAFRTPASGRGVLFDIQISFDLRKIEKESLEPIFEESDKGALVPIEIDEYLKRNGL